MLHYANNCLNSHFAPILPMNCQLVILYQMALYSWEKEWVNLRGN
jgi:hypothetical protein